MNASHLVTGKPQSPPSSRWQRSVAEAIRSAEDLCAALRIPCPDSAPAESDFPVFVPPEFLAKIESGNRADPLLRQVLPLPEETATVPGFTADPLQELTATPTPGILHKYPGRALLVTTHACAVHCRYCFRRHFPYDTLPRGRDAWETALESIRNDRSIEEVLLSGGDPLMLVDSNLTFLVRSIAAIPHVQRLRLHTRLPIMIPSRVTDPLLSVLTESRLTALVVVHANHPNEIDQEVANGLQRFVDSGIPVLNQSVLLRGVNDDPDSLIELSKRLIACRVMPYYLHQLDRVAGAAHFDVSSKVGQRLVARMRRALPGYAVPRYVRETPTLEHKEVLS